MSSLLMQTPLLIFGGMMLTFAVTMILTCITDARHG